MTRVEPLSHLDGETVTESPLRGEGAASLRESVRSAVRKYLDELDGQMSTEVYQMVLAEVEAPLLEEIMAYTRNNQTKASIMLGLNRSVSGTAHGRFEYLRIVQTKIDTYYWARPGGAKETPFKMTKATENHVVFENPDHDFPKRIEYRLDGDELTAQISGDEPGPSWTWKRIGDVQ